MLESIGLDFTSHALNQYSFEAKGFILQAKDFFVFSLMHAHNSSSKLLVLGRVPSSFYYFNYYENPEN